jgi:leader peptidase (prepilin peptidase)/N-methyltransferase
MDIHLWFAALLGGFGLLIGSFLNVAAIRTLKKQSVSFPPSHCVHCKHRLHALDLIPVFSYVFLRGRCRYCKERISPVYPIGEGAAAFLFAWTGWHFGPYNSEWIAGLLLVSVLHIIIHTDLKAMLIPNKVIFTGAATAVALRAFLHPLPIWNYASAAALGFGLLYFLAVISRGGMGGGDIKLYLFIGAVCGLQATLLSLFVASLLGTVYGLSMKLSGRLQPKQPIPFGPFIAVGAWLSYLYADRWVQAYIGWWML